MYTIGNEVEFKECLLDIQRLYLLCVILYVYSSFRLQTNDSTTLHLAAAGGHREVVKVLLEAGASATDENAVSVTEQNFVYLNILVNVHLFFEINLVLDLNN